MPHCVRVEHSANQQDSFLLVMKRGDEKVFLLGVGGGGGCVRLWLKGGGRWKIFEEVKGGG